MAEFAAETDASRVAGRTADSFDVHPYAFFERDGRSRSAQGRRRYRYIDVVSTHGLNDSGRAETDVIVSARDLAVDRVRMFAFSRLSQEPDIHRALVLRVGRGGMEEQMKAAKATVLGDPGHVQGAGRHLR